METARASVEISPRHTSARSRPSAFGDNTAFTQVGVLWVFNIEFSIQMYSQDVHGGADD